MLAWGAGTLLALLSLEACVIQSDIHRFNVGIMHTSEVKSLSDETAYSYPIPLTNGYVAVYAYNLLGLPPSMPRVSAPTVYIEAIFPSGQIVQFHSIHPAALGVPLPDGESLGKVSFPPEYAALSAAEFNRRQELFEDAYSHAISAYLAHGSIDSRTASQVLMELPVFGKKPLMPLFQITNPAFFTWLDLNGRRR